MAMEGNRSHYEQGIRALEELNSLMGPDTTPLVQKVLFHLSELNEDITKMNSDLNSFDQVKECLTKRMDNTLYQSLIVLTDAKNINLFKDFDDLTIARWEVIYSLLPTYFNIVALMKFEENVTMNISSDSIVLEGKVNLSEEIVGQRELIYRAIREFLDKKSVLTYKITEGLNGPYLRLELDVSHREDKCYVVDLGHEDNIYLGFSNLFKNYEISVQGKDLGEHLIIKISKNLEVEKLNSLESFEGHLIHFPFLFHPISIIIPKKGEVLPLEKIDLLRSTGSCSLERKQDVKTQLRHQHSVNFKYIDFFALISKS